MNRVLLFLFVLFCNCVFVIAQKNTCESEHEKIEDLQNIDKCNITSEENESKKIRKKELRKTVRFFKKRNNRKVAVSLVKTNTIKNNELIKLAQKDWKETKELALTISKSTVNKNEVSFTVVEEIPLFSKCKTVEKDKRISCFNTEMSNHIRKHFNYPKKALKERIEGSVVVKFTIDKEGKIRSIQTTGSKKIRLLKEEAMRVVEKLPRFIPGRHKGEIVNVNYVMPVNFKL